MLKSVSDALLSFSASQSRLSEDPADVFIDEFSVSGDPEFVEPSSAPLAPPQPQPQLPAEILSRLGRRLKSAPVEAPPLHEEIAVRWQEVLSEGVSAEEKLELAGKYPIPSNCSFFTAPGLNMEVRASLSPPAVQRDERLVAKQTSFARSLAASAKGLTLLLSSQLPEEILLPLVEAFSDASRLVADAHFEATAVRRSLALGHLKPSYQEILKKTSPGEFLFGPNLDKVLQSAKAVASTSKDLKESSARSARPAAAPKNFRIPPRTPASAHPRAVGGAPRIPKSKSSHQYRRPQPDQSRQQGQNKPRTRR